jgi:hypothetical protein
MLPGMVILLLGYVTLYWGIHHFPGQTRYGFWTLLGLGNVMSAGTPVQFKS